MRELPRWLKAGDLLVFNNTRVLPARLFGFRTATGGRWDGLYIEADGTGNWHLLCETRGRLTSGETITVIPAYDPQSFPAGDSLELWGYRLMQLEIQVAGRSPVKTLEFEKVTLLLLAGEQTGRSSPCSRVKDGGWLNSHSMDRILLPCPDSTGTAQARVPMLPGYRVCASAPGWNSAVERMPFGPEAGARLRLELEKASISVRGTLRDADGKPLANVGVAAYIVVEMPYDQVDKAAFRAVGHGYTYTAKVAENRAVVCYMTVATTGTDGRFQIEAKVAGQLILIARPTGPWQHVIEEAGHLGSDISDVELVVRRSSGYVTISKNGAALAGERITIADIEDWRFNPAFGATLDERGRMPTGGFTRGHEYALRLKSNPIEGFYLVWEGQERIDLASLPNRRASIRAAGEK